MAPKKLEAELPVAKAELHQALAHEKLAKQGRTVPSKSRYITQADLEGARYARGTAKGLVMMVGSAW